MAGGAYKGLTIRIGADTTDLSRALRGVDSAAFKTQRELTKLSRAAQIDPKQSELARVQLGAMANQANTAAMKMMRLKTAHEQAFDEPSSAGSNAGKSIGQLAKETDNAALAAAEATARYNALNAAIEPAYKEVKKLTGIDLREATNEGEFDRWFELIKDSGEVSQETITKIESMKGAWMEARAAMDDYGKVESLHNANTEMALAESQVRAAAKAMAQLNTSSSMARSLKQEANDLGLLGAAADTVSHRLSRLNGSMSFDSTNIDVARERSKALADAMSIAEKQGEILNQRLMAYKDAGYEETSARLSAEYGSVAEALEKTKSAYESTSEKVAIFKAQVDDARATLAQMEQTDDGSEETAANIEKQRQKVAELDEAYQEVADAQKKAETAYDSAKACSEMDNLRLRIIENNDQMVRLRDSFGGIEIRSGVSLQVSQLAQSLRVISTGAETAQSRFAALNRAVEIRPYNLGLAVDRVRAFREAADAAQQKAANLRQQIDQYKSEGIDRIARRTNDAAIAFEKAQDEVNDLTKRLAEAEAQFGKDSDEARKLGEELNAALLKANTAAAVNEYKNLQVELRNVETEAHQLRDSMRVSFQEIGAAAVVAAQQVGQLSMQAWRSISEASTEVDSSYRDLRKTFDATEEEYQSLYDAAMQFGQSNVTSAATMLEMESIAAQLGVGLEGGAESIRKFAEAAANLDVATNIDAETIALQMGQIKNVMSDLDNDNIDKFGDALVRLGNNMPTQESNIMQITQRLSAVGDVAHFSTPELMGWAAAIASTGQKSEAAASGIATTVTKISTAASAGEEAVKGFADVAGMSADEFIKAWRSDPSETLKAFVNGLKDAGDDVFATLTGLEIKGVRQNQTLASLAQTVDTVDDAVRMANDAFNGLDDEFGKAGDAANEASKKAQGFSGVSQKLENSIQVLAATFGDAMVPYMELAINGIQRLTEWIKGLDKETLDMGIKAGGAFAIFATTYPVVNALGGAIRNFASGALQMLIGGLAFLVGGGPITSIGDLFAAIALGAEGAAGAIGAFVAAGGGVALALGGVAAAVGAVALYDWNKTRESAMRFDSTMKGIKGTTEGLHGELLIGTNNVKDYAEAWSAAGTDMDEFYKKQQNHISAMSDSRQSATDTVGALEKYQQIIQDAMGAGEDWGGNISELQWALDGLADITGETYTAEQILTGAYGDERDETENLAKSIEKLIEQKKKQSQLDALTNMRTEAIQGQMEAKEAMDEAAESYRNYAKIVRENYQDVINGQYGGDWNAFMDSDNSAAEHLKELESEWTKTKKVYDEWGEKIQTIDNEYEGLYNKDAFNHGSAFGEREGIIQTTEAMKEASAALLDLDDNGIKRLAQGLQDAQVGTNEFATMTGETFRNLAEQSDGDMDKFIALVDEWNRTELLDKYAGFHFDEEGNLVNAENERVEWNGNNWEPVHIEVDNAGAKESVEEVKEQAASEPATEDIKGDNTEAKKSVDEVTEYAESTEATVKVKSEVEQPENVATDTTANVTVKVDSGKLGSLNKSLSNLPKDVRVNVTTKADKKPVDNLHTALKNTAKSWNATLNARVNGKSSVDSLIATLRDVNGRHYSTTYDIYRITHTKSVKDGGNARGGHIPFSDRKIPRHADGFIATRATLTQYGWIGEDGAEAYSGGSLVPLTNRKYSQPYIDDISDAVARKLGPQQSAPQITVTVSGVSSPDEVADAIGRKLALLGL